MKNFSSSYFFPPIESNLSFFYIPSFIDALMHMMHVKVQKLHVRHLALMCYMWYIIIVSFTLALMYDNLHVKLSLLMYDNLHVKLQ